MVSAAPPFKRWWGPFGVTGWQQTLERSLTIPRVFRLIDARSLALIATLTTPLCVEAVGLGNRRAIMYCVMEIRFQCDGERQTLRIAQIEHAQRHNLTVASLDRAPTGSLRRGEERREGRLQRRERRSVARLRRREIFAYQGQRRPTLRVVGPAAMACSSRRMAVPF